MKLCCVSHSHSFSRSIVILDFNYRCNSPSKRKSLHKTERRRNGYEYLRTSGDGAFLAVSLEESSRAAWMLSNQGRAGNFENASISTRSIVERHARPSLLTFTPWRFYGFSISSNLSTRLPEKRSATGYQSKVIFHDRSRSAWRVASEACSRRRKVCCSAAEDQTCQQRRRLSCSCRCSR